MPGNQYTAGLAQKAAVRQRRAGGFPFAHALIVLAIVASALSIFVPAVREQLSAATHNRISLLVEPATAPTADQPLTLE